MRSIVLLYLVLLTSMPGAEADSPLVPGYERFYRDQPGIEAGALLYSELGCANCHGGSPVEIRRQGPSLMHLSKRVSRKWVKSFLQDPGKTREGSPMPSFTHQLSDAEQESVIAYLGTLGAKHNLKVSRHVNAERGSALYHEKGCTACHAPTSDYRGPNGKSGAGPSWLTPLPELASKTDLIALHDLLTHFSKYRPDGRMPHIALETQDAIDIAAHLLDFQASDPREADRIENWPAADKKQVDQGRSLFFSNSCHACHDVPDPPESKTIQISGANRSGCLETSPQPGIPHFSLDENQIQSVLQFLQNSGDGENTEDPAQLTLTAMNCYACHDRNGVGGPVPETDVFFHGEESLGDSGRLPPPLTDIGHKLKPEWLVGVLQGKNRVRPYLKTRMPAYPGQAKILTGLLTSADAPQDTQPLNVNPEHLQAGRKLMGTNGGVNCVTCHNWKDKTSPGIPGPDLSSLDKRLNPDWFREYLLNPAAYRPGTLMPPLWPGGKSMVPDILEGNTEQQIAAIWLYSKQGTEPPAGYIDSAGKFELIPTDRPIIQRTFFENAGGRAILVGFPGKIHLAFDGENGHPALIWRGAFFDAYETWFLRKAEFQKPLSEDVAAFDKPPKNSRFLGYEIDSDGNPVFLLRQNGRAYREHYRVEDETLYRKIIADNLDDLEFYHPKSLNTESRKESGQITFLYSWK